jgi:putative endonuclease
MGTMNWQVYIILCSDTTLYTGITNNLARRYSLHAACRGARYFRGRRPTRVVYLESGHSHASASRREAVIKKLRRGDKIKLIGSSLNEVAEDGNVDHASCA